jgi:hypothetical protein
MSSPKKVFVIISDQNTNLSMFLVNSNYIFPSIDMLQSDYKIGNNDDMASYNTAIRLVNQIFNLSIDRNRLYDISLKDNKGDKIYVFLCKLNSTEMHELQKFFLGSLIPTFININNLPKNLDVISSAIAYVITRNINLIKDAEPKAIAINFPYNLIPFTPLFPIPILIPIRYASVNKPIFVTSPRVPKIESSDIKIKLVPRKPSPKKPSPKSISPKKPSPKSISPSITLPKSPSPKVIKKKISPIIRKKLNSPVSSVNSKSSKKSKKKGGYYEKYLKYKIKYLESEKHILYLEEKINKYNSI